VALNINDTSDQSINTSDLVRAEWGLFRDRRPDLYQPIISLDGASPEKEDWK